MPDEQEHVKVTMNMLYQQQIEATKEQSKTNELLVQAITRLEHLADLPERMRQAEITLAKMEWIDRLAKTALGGAIISFGTAVFNLFNK